MPGDADASGKASKLSEEELKVLLEHFDKNKDGTLSDEEIVAIVSDYKSHKTSKKTINPDVVKILKRYDVDGDGQLSASEIDLLVHEVRLTDTSARYAAYSVGFAR